MSPKETAFPQHLVFDMETGEQVVPEDTQQGLSVRDYFAAAAMRGILASGQWRASGEVVANAYRFADAMMEARKG